MKFTELQLIDPILRALTDEGYETPTPIQQQAIPIVLNKIDLLGCAQTGTGKTAAFAIPMLQNLYKTKSNEKGFKKIKALVLTPTRELAIQIEESFKAYGPLHWHYKYCNIWWCRSKTTNRCFAQRN
jgi:ATP-dependent RNA helicase RhlE